MADYNRDIADAKTAFQDWGWHEGNVLSNRDADTIRNLLEKFSDERSTCLDSMAHLLELREENLSEKWQRLSEWGLDLVKKLEADIVAAGTNSDPSYNSMSALGLNDLAEGEKKIWQECRRATTATMADIIFEIEQSDSELIKTLEEDLKNALHDGAVASELMARFGYTYVDGLRDVGKATISLGASTLKALVGGIGLILGPAVKALTKKGLDAAMKANETAKEKQVYKNIILANRKKIDDLKEKINDNAIQTALKEGVSFAKSLRGLGSSGSYRGTDWDSFGAECENKLKSRAEPALDRAQHLFREVYPALQQGLVDVFSTLLANLENLEKFKGQLDPAVVAVYEALDKDEQVLDGMMDEGPNKVAAKAALRAIRQEVQETIQGFYDALRDAQSNS
jgi:hypothetical protein